MTQCKTICSSLISNYPIKLWPRMHLRCLQITKLLIKRKALISVNDCDNCDENYLNYDYKITWKMHQKYHNDMKNEFTKNLLAYNFSGKNVWSLFLNCSQIAFSTSRMLLLVLLLQLPGPPILTIFSNLCTGSRYMNALNTKLSPPRISSSSLLLYVTAWSQHSTAFSIHSIIHIGLYAPTTNSLQSQDHKPLFYNTSLAEQDFSYSSCSLLVWCITITQLFSIIMLWS